MGLPFGSLKQVGLRELWKNEASDFTDWLSQKENLDTLASELEMRLEFVEREKSIGDYSADIIARIPNPDSDIEELAVIENQLEESDHDHLGKLITYAAGVEAKVVILICKELHGEHRTAINWLNQISSGEVKFFVVKIEAWQIDDSRPAPKFNVISQPDDWGKNVKQSVQTNKGETETKKLQGEFWNTFVEYLKNNKSSLRPRQVYHQHWCDISIGSSKGYISLTVDTRHGMVAASFYSSDDPEKHIFQYLNERQKDIEKEMDGNLTWMELTGKKASRIKSERMLDIKDRTQWPLVFKFFQEQGEKIQHIFPKYLKEIDE